MSTIEIEVQCPICQTKQTIVCDEDGYNRWEDGAVIQKALPTLTSTEREALITGICDPCWDRMGE